MILKIEILRIGTLVNTYINWVNTNLTLEIKKAKLEKLFTFVKSGLLDLSNI